MTTSRRERSVVVPTLVILGLTAWLPSSDGFSAVLSSSSSSSCLRPASSASLLPLQSSWRTIPRIRQRCTCVTATTTTVRLSLPQHVRKRRSSTTTTTTLHATTTTAVSFSRIFPLIASGDCWGNWAVLTGTAAAAQILGTTTAIGQLLGPPVTAMALTFVLASIGVLTPGGTVAAKQLQLLSLQLATPLILMGADLRDAGKRCGPLLISFAAASMATLIASLVGWYGTGSLLSAALGRHDGLVIAAALLAKNVGGGINYIAVCRTLNANPTAVAAGLCVDNIFALVYFPVTSALAKRYPDVVVPVSGAKDFADGTNGTNGANGSPFSLSLASPMIAAVPTQQQRQRDTEGPSIDGLNVVNGTASTPLLSSATRQSNGAFSMVSVQAISNVLCLSTILLWLGERIGGPTGALPLTTLFTLVLASWMPRARLEPLQPAAHCLGLVSLYLFFATAGAPGLAVAESVRAALVPLSLFLTCLYGIHGGILTMLNRFLGQRFAAFYPQRLLVSSSAAIGGPATAVALAEAAGWKSLSVPSLLVGNVGYAIATFLGIAYFSGLRR